MYDASHIRRTCLALLVVVAAAFVLSSPERASAATADVSVTVAITECSDGIDNDFDGFIDHPNDPDCGGASDDDESTPPAPPPPAPPSGSGGGGGGSSGSPRQQGTDTGPLSAGISFSGTAYPSARVVVLRNGFSYLSGPADSLGRFFMEDERTTPGTYTFSVKARDSKGRESAPTTFSMILPNNRSVFVGDVILPPTIEISPSNIPLAGAVTVSGETLPGINVEISVAENKYAARSGPLGTYSRSLKPDLPSGFYTVRAKPLLGDGIDRFSVALSLRIGDTAGLFDPREASRGDLDGNSRVNLVDFSILAFWYRKGNPPASVDLNGDGTVDLQDMSVLAYYWTG